MVAKSKIFGGVLLVAGTAIGAGMLALPIATGLGGFLPACITYFLCWLFMAATGLLLLEICLWMPQDANMVSMAYHLLGKVGKAVSWVLYLFLFYCLTIAYEAGGGGFITAIFQGSIPSWAGILIFMLVFSPIVYIGTRAIDRVNMILMAGLTVSYLAFVFLGIGHVQVNLLTQVNWKAGFLALPVIFTSFSYQGVIPSLTTYLQRNARAVRMTILLGTAIPFFVYALWELLILGIVPLEGPHGLIAAQKEGLTAATPLKYFVGSPWVYAIGQAFSFFALTTSFLGVTLGLFDFLADGLKIKKEGRKKVGLFFAVYLPPTLIALFNPHIFLSALTYAGGIGCALLLGLLPILMVWVGRYRKKLSLSYAQFSGGKWVLALLFCFVIFELIIEVMNEF